MILENCWRNGIFYEKVVLGNYGEVLCEIEGEPPTDEDLAEETRPIVESAGE